MWMFPKIVIRTPKSSFFNRIFHYFRHPFWGIPLFLERSIQYATPYLGEMIPILTFIFFRWLGFPHQLDVLYLDFDIMMVYITPTSLKELDAISLAAKALKLKLATRPSPRKDRFEDVRRLKCPKVPYHKRHSGLLEDGCFQKWWVSPTTMGFPTKNDHFGVFWGYPYFWKHPYADWLLGKCSIVGGLIQLFFNFSPRTLGKMNPF